MADEEGNIYLTKVKNHAKSRNKPGHAESAKRGAVANFKAFRTARCAIGRVFVAVGPVALCAIVRARFGLYLAREFPQNSRKRRRPRLTLLVMRRDHRTTTRRQTGRSRTRADQSEPCNAGRRTGGRRIIQIAGEILINRNNPVELIWLAWGGISIEMMRQLSPVDKSQLIHL